MNSLSRAFNSFSTGKSCLLLLALVVSPLQGATTEPSAQGSLADPKALAPTATPAPEDIVHGLVNLDFSNYHVTTRGLNLNNRGVISQSLLRLEWTLYKPQPDPRQVIDEVTLTTAMWNEVDSHAVGHDPGHWSEIDAIIGPNVKFCKDWTAEMPFTAFVSETDTFWTCWAFDPRLTYHDHFIKDFSINPYVELFDELENKVTVVFNRQKSQESYYGVVGMDPTYVFKDIPLKLELPTYFNIPGEKFYQRHDGSGGGTDIGLFSTTFKATVPLEFLNSKAGRWSLYGAVQYDYFNNPGLLDGNEFKGADKSRERNLVFFHAGIAVRF